MILFVERRIDSGIGEIGIAIVEDLVGKRGKSGAIFVIFPRKRNRGG